MEWAKYILYKKKTPNKYKTSPQLTDTTHDDNQGCGWKLLS